MSSSASPPPPDPTTGGTPTATRRSQRASYVSQHLARTSSPPSSPSATSPRPQPKRLTFADAPSAPTPLPSQTASTPTPTLSAAPTGSRTPSLSASSVANTSSTAAAGSPSPSTAHVLQQRNEELKKKVAVLSSAKRDGDASIAAAKKLQEEQRALLHYARALELREVSLRQDKALSVMRCLLAHSHVETRRQAFQRWREMYSHAAHTQRALYQAQQNLAKDSVKREQLQRTVKHLDTQLQDVTAAAGTTELKLQEKLVAAQTRAAAAEAKVKQLLVAGEAWVRASQPPSTPVTSSASDTALLTQSCDAAREAAKTWEKRARVLEATVHKLAAVADAGLASEVEAPPGETTAKTLALVESLKVLQGRLADAKQTSDEADARATAAEEEAQRAHDLCAAWQKRHTDACDELSKVRDEYAKTLLRGQTQLADLHSAEAAQASLAATIAEKDTLLIQHRAVTQELVGIVKAQKQDLAAVTESLEAERMRTVSSEQTLEAVTHERKQLQVQLALARDEEALARGTTDDSKRHVVALEAELGTLRSSVSALQIELDNAEARARMTVQAELDALQTQVAAVQKEVTKAHAELAELSVSHATAQASNQVLRAELEAATPRINELEARLLESKAAEAEAMVVAKTATAEAKSAAANAAVETAAALAAAKAATPAVAPGDADLPPAGELKAELVQLQREVEILRDSNSTAQSRLDDASATNIQLTAILTQRTEEVLFLQAMVRKQQGAYTELGQQLSTMSKASAATSRRLQSTLKGARGLVAELYKKPDPSLHAVLDAIRATFSLDGKEDGELEELPPLPEDHEVRVRLADAEEELADAEAEVGQRGEEIDLLSGRVRELEDNLQLSQAEVWRLTEEIMDRIERAESRRARERGLEMALGEADIAIAGMRERLTNAGLSAPVVSPPAQRALLEPDASPSRASVSSNDHDPNLSPSATIDATVAALEGFDASTLPPEAQSAFQELLELAEHGNVLFRDRNVQDDGDDVTEEEEEEEETRRGKSRSSSSRRHQVVDDMSPLVEEEEEEEEEES